MRRILIVSAIGLGLGHAHAATPLETLRYSPDTTAMLGIQTVGDEDAAADDLAGSVSLLNLGSLPDETDLDAYHRLENDEHLLSFDTTVDLPGGVVARPGDVVRYDGALYSVEFDADANGVPDGTDLDALTLLDDILLMSFDVTAELDGMTFHDEDLVLFDGASFSLFLDGSSAGVTPDLAIDAVHRIDCNDHLLISFDGSGSVASVVFDDEDLLEYNAGAGTWELAYDGSAATSSWRSADLDAVHATIDPGPGPALLFGQTILAQSNKADFQWANPVEFVSVRGDFVTSADIGTYAINTETSGTGTLITDNDVPVSSSGYWYLVRHGGCELSSWQTTPGAEPGRDLALP